MKEANILVYGNSAREHAIAESISKSHLLNNLFTTNDFRMEKVEVLDFKHMNYKAQAKYSAEKGINLVIFSSSKPLCEGAGEIFKNENIAVIGVNKIFSQLESSKLFAKKFMNKYGIKSARILSDKSKEFPQVIKDNELCNGDYCVNIVNTIEEKLQILKKIKDKNYFTEEYLDGDEIGIITYITGDNFINFLPTREFKKLSNEKNSPVTEGMGAYCPVNLNANQKLKLNIYLCKLEYALRLENANFDGFIYSSLIWVDNDWYVLKYSISPGDLELQALLTHLKSDFLETLIFGSNPEYKDGIGASLAITAEGYPKKPIKNEIIVIPKNNGTKTYYSEVKFAGETIISDGGRVMTICTNSNTPFEILYDFAQKIKMEHKYYRKNLQV